MIDTASNPLTERTALCFSGKTRHRILQTSLVLFNARSFQTVTTAMIAKKADVLEGTLWYHFPSKKDILTAHIELLKSLFEEESMPAGAEDAETIVHGIFQSYDVIWDFRYILRDDFSVALKNEPEALLAAQAINAFLDHWTEGRVLHSNQCGILKLRADTVAETSELILLIGRYWLDFSTKKYPQASQELLRQKGLAHIFNVLDPYLNESARRIVLELLKA
jgi:AcrR family transcriptional regulator